LPKVSSELELVPSSGGNGWRQIGKGFERVLHETGKGGEKVGRGATRGACVGAGAAVGGYIGGVPGAVGGAAVGAKACE
jgi:hypothetical protein